MTVSRPEIIKRLEEQNIRYTELCLDGGVTILVSELGGRVFGPFLTAESDSLLWVNPDFSSPQAFEKLVREGWNLGGERLWIAPEIQYLVRDRTDYFGSLFIPADMDPGRWKMDVVSPALCRLGKDLSLEAFNLAGGTKHLHLETEIRPAANPLRHLAEYAGLMEGIVYAGHQQTVSLAETALDDILSGVWNLLQLPPGGDLIIPCTPGVDPTLYKGVTDGLQEITGNHVRLRLTARQMYKTGYNAAHHFGRMGYVRRLADGRLSLLVRNFPNHPSSEYPEEPPDQPGRRGDSIYIYNDDGQFGDFGEMECSAQTIGGLTGRSSASDTLSLWLFVGSPEAVRRIGMVMLGVTL